MSFRGGALERWCILICDEVRSRSKTLSFHGSFGVRRFRFCALTCLLQSFWFGVKCFGDEFQRWCFREMVGRWVVVPQWSGGAF